MPVAGSRLKDRGALATARASGRGQPQRSPITRQEVGHPGPNPATLAIDQLTAPELLRLQRLLGNRAVGDLLQQRSMKPLQRVTLGWSGAQADSWNAGEQTVNAQGHKAAAGEQGIVRIPVTGIASGRTGAVKDEMGRDSDPNIAKLGKKHALVSEVTTEAAGGETGGEAIVIVPSGLAPGPVDILFHLHGHTIGYRQAKHDKRPAPPPRDVQYDRIEQQLMAAAGEGVPMVGILPQGAFASEFGPGGQAGLNADAYVQDVFGLGVPELKGHTPGRVTLSGWSGAGLGVTQMIAGSKAAAAGKAVPGGAKGSLLPTSNFEGLFLFDAIYGNWLDTIWGWLRQRLQRELKQLADLAASNPDATAAKQEEWIAAHGFRFRGIYTTKGGCKANYESLRDKLFKKWFAAHAKGLPAPVAERWQANYHVAFSGEGVQHNEMIGKQGEPGQENLLKAIEMLPTVAATKHSSTQGPTSPVAVRHPGGATTPPRQEVTGPTSAVAGPDELLIAAAVALGRAGKGTGRPAGGTLLHDEDVRAAIANRAKNAPLAERFTQAEAVVRATPEGETRAAAANREAAGLVHVLEMQFILDPSRSALDLLPAERASKWKTFHWEKYDYPGHKKGDPVGAHEGQAAAMAVEMTAVRPERRPNKGATAVMIESQATAERWHYIAKHSPAVPGESGAALFEEAGAAFVKMREAAKADGVRLRILSSFRTPEKAKANAARAGNSAAVASFSSHSLGLAVDLEMSAGKQQYEEITTTPMQNVADMRSAPAHKWMVLFGEAHGWYPYGNEPWHWEYNPPGLKDRFFNAAAPVKQAPAPTASTTTPAVAAAPGAGERLSGAHWVAQYPTGRKLDSLIDPFKGNVTSFIAMLKANQAKVHISATYRPPERAWLMHWAWAIAHDKVKYSKLKGIANPYNVDIVWDHGDRASSKAAAQAMVNGYQMAHTAALASRHTEGRAVDMTITDLPRSLTLSKDHEVDIGTGAATGNKELHRLAEIYYSVFKLLSDPPHWSEDGS